MWKTIKQNGWHKHFVIAMLLAFISLWMPFLEALLCCSILFIGKEVVDRYKPNPTGFDWRDLVVDYLGFLLIRILNLIL